MMKSNFEFLNSRFPVLANFGELAEKYLYSDSNSCLMKLGMIGETIVNLCFTYDRILRVMSRLAQIQHFVPGAKCVLLFPGVLTDRLRMMLEEYQAEIWDRDYIWSVFREQIEQAGHPVFTSALRPCRPSDGDSQTPEQEYIDRLWSCVPGKADWNSYQKTVGDILSYLFCPPLSLPLTEKSDAMHANRRDFIFPNYCDTGFWAFLRSRYGADYIEKKEKNYE